MTLTPTEFIRICLAVFLYSYLFVNLICIRNSTRLYIRLQQQVQVIFTSGRYGTTSWIGSSSHISLICAIGCNLQAPEYASQTSLYLPKLTNIPSQTDRIFSSHDMLSANSTSGRPGKTSRRQKIYRTCATCKCLLSLAFCVR